MCLRKPLTFSHQHTLLCAANSLMGRSNSFDLQTAAAASQLQKCAEFLSLKIYETFSLPLIAHLIGHDPNHHIALPDRETGTMEDTDMQNVQY